MDQTSRLGSVTYPSSTGLSTSYSYYGNVAASGTGNGDQRLSEIENLKSGSTVLSKFDYTYNPVGTIATWKQQADSGTPNQYGLTYDATDQLTDAELVNTSTSSTVASNKYAYDPAGNRLAETTLSATAGGQFNNLNQLTGYSGSTSSQTVAGNTSATAASLTVNAVPATISSGTNFTANVPLPTGTNTVSIVAKPATGAPTTQRYQIVTTGTAATQLTYDANGDTLTDESGNEYTWDALNRLTDIVYTAGTNSGSHTEFAYDGLSRRIQIVERTGTTLGTGTVTSTKNYLWIGNEMAEERDVSDTVTKRFFPQGEQQSGINFYYTRDHLGSVREMCNSSGAIVARYSYDPYGRVTLVSGSNLATMQYTGDYVHQTSGLNLTKYRAYDPNTARWLSRDPNGTADVGYAEDILRNRCPLAHPVRPGAEVLDLSPDLYTYVTDDPINRTDPTGLAGGGRGNPLTSGWWADSFSCPCSSGKGTFWCRVGGYKHKFLNQTVQLQAAIKLAQEMMAVGCEARIYCKSH